MYVGLTKNKLQFQCGICHQVEIPIPMEYVTKCNGVSLQSVFKEKLDQSVFHGISRHDKNKEEKQMCIYTN